MRATLGRVAACSRARLSRDNNKWNRDANFSGIIFSLFCTMKNKTSFKTKQSYCQMNSVSKAVTERWKIVKTKSKTIAHDHSYHVTSLQPELRTGPKTPEMKWWMMLLNWLKSGKNPKFCAGPYIFLWISRNSR